MKETAKRAPVSNIHNSKVWDVFSWVVIGIVVGALAIAALILVLSNLLVDHTEITPDPTPSPIQTTFTPMTTWR